VSPDLAAVRTRLEADRASLEAELERLTAVKRDPTATIGFGKRVGEGTSEAIGRIERVGQAGALSSKLAGVMRALDKLDESSYGVCDVCGDPIPELRLDARPSSVRCVSCSAEPG
jgi:DnaK suppressor protein